MRLFLPHYIRFYNEPSEIRSERPAGGKGKRRLGSIFENYRIIRRDDFLESVYFIMIYNRSSVLLNGLHIHDITARQIVQIFENIVVASFNPDII